MTKWLTSIFLLLALSGGIFAGVPFKSGEQECSMECCHKALSHESSPEVTAANLCCAVFCIQSGSTSAAVKMPQFTPVVVAVLYLATLKMPLVTVAKRQPQKFASKVLIKDSKPIFILHHALLI